MIVLDTNVLAYAVGGDHPHREGCAGLVSAIREGRVHAVTTHSVIQEFAHMRSRRSSRAEAASLASSFAVLLAPLLPVDDETLDVGLKLFERHKLGAFDAILAAAALANEAVALVSADKDFRGIRGLRHVAPGTPEFDALVGN